jgi:TRAP-type transport system periplasmic protein
VEEESNLASQLQESGMEFVEVDKAAFAEKAEPAVLESVDPSIRETVEKLFAD